MKPAQRAAKLRHSVQQLHNAYQVGFAGQPRLTRAAGQLDAWVTQLKTLSTQAKVLPPQFKKEIASLIQDRIKLYQSEAKAIRTAQELNIVSQVAYGHIEWIKLHSDRYQRHFAGQSRNTRDGSLLSELIVEAQVWLQQAKDHLEANQGQLEESAAQDLASWIERVGESEAMYQEELKKITEAQQEQGTAQERADLYAFMANQCFQLYRAHFSGHPRNSRRLATLERCNSQLDLIAGLMQGVISKEKSGLEDAQRAEANLDIVQKNLAGYQEEERQVDMAQTQMDYNAWVKSLGEAAQKVYQDYTENFANKPRSGCDPQLLGHLCDRLYDIAIQLRPFVEYSPEPEERGLLFLMLDQLRLYHREFGLVTEAVKAQQEVRH
jgi:hypothetical protein